MFLSRYFTIATYPFIDYNKHLSVIIVPCVELRSVYGFWDKIHSMDDVKSQDQINK